MKALLALAVALAAVAPAQAEMFRPGGGRGAPENRDRGPVRVEHPGARHHGHYIYRQRPVVQVSYRPAYYPVYGYYPGYGVGYPYAYYDSVGYYSPGRASSTGFWLGALAGGIIGHNSGDFRHNGWRGAAWGAGAGWLLGSIVDANRRYDEYASAPAVTAPVVYGGPQATPAAAPQPAPQQVTIINNYYNTSPMSGANSLFGR